MKSKQTRKLFALPPGKMMPAARVKFSPNRLPPSVQKIDNVLSQLIPDYKEQAASYARDQFVNSITNSGGGNKSNNNNAPTPAPGGALVFQGTKSNPEGNGTYALSKAPNPKRIRLNSNIKPNTYANDYMTPVENGCSPLHVSTCTLGIPTSIANNPLASYFQGTICFDIQTRAQANVAYSLDIATKLSATQLTTAFNAAIAALQTYFYYSSVLAYESDARNKNAGMIALRSSIDAQTLSDLAQLGRRLEDTPIPPRIVEWVRYMCGNFLSADTQGAPLLKIVPYAGVTGTALISPSYPALRLADLNNDANNTVYTLLRSSIPQWRVKRLWDLPVTPVYDPNFLSIWANLPTRNRPSAANLVYPTVANTSTEISYNAFSNNLDAVAYAMSSIYINATSEFIPGLVVPSGTNAGFIDNRVSYYNVAGTKQFYSVVNLPFLGLSRQESNTCLGATNYTPHIFGTDKCQAVSGTTLLQSAQNTLDYLFNINTIPLKGSVNSFNKKANGKI